jgi:hypothetical protein
LALEYALGFGFGWLFFQAFAMRDMAGGSYVKSLKMTFIPEFLSMNVLMAGMMLVSKFWMAEVAGSSHPSHAAFWFIMSMSLVVGFLCAYPMNWWLVTRHLKHGMMTVQAEEHQAYAEQSMDASHHAGQGNMKHEPAQATPTHHEHAQHHEQTRPAQLAVLTAAAISVVILTVATTIVLLAAAHPAA